MKNILWDFGGIILDSMTIRDHGFRTIFEKYPKEMVEEFILYHRKNDGLSRFHKIKYFYNEVLNKKISEKDKQSYAQQFVTIMRQQFINQKYLINEIIDLIKENHIKYSLDIASSSELKELNFLCEKLELSKCFLTINGSPTHKDELVKNILSLDNYKHQDVILIGDSIKDYAVVKVNNIEFYGFNNKELKDISKNYINSYRELQC